MEYEHILALFQGFESFYEARIWIRIRIRMSNSDPHTDNRRSQTHSNPWEHYWISWWQPFTNLLSSKPWIPIRNQNQLDLTCWIRILIETNESPQHCRQHKVANAMIWDPVPQSLARNRLHDNAMDLIWKNKSLDAGRYDRHLFFEGEANYTLLRRSPNLSNI